MQTSNFSYNFLFGLLLIFLSSCEKKPYSTGPDIYVEDTGFKIVGYLGAGGFDQIDALELDKLTYLNLAFANPDKDGNLIFSRNSDIKPIVNKGHEAGLKVFVSLAGGGRPDTTVWKSVLQPANRSTFVKEILDFVEENNLDGVDVDIEWNLLPSIGELYTPFVVELRNALHARGKGITTALGATGLHEAVSQESLEAYDFINVMVYDKTGIWRPEDIGPHSPYSYAEEAIKFWTEERKIPADRITLGVPFYGFDFTAPARYISFKKIIEENPSYAYQDSVNLRYYNGIPMIVKKTELAKKKLGGVMIWEISQDTLSEMSLLRAMHQTILAGDCEVKTFYKDVDGDGLGNPTRPIQACERPKGYVDNRDGLAQERLKIATCQFPVTGKIQNNADYIKKFIGEAADNKADIVHFSEAALSGYPPGDIPSFENYDWETLRSETHEIISLAKEKNIWVILGSAHHLSKNEKPLNSLYIISNEGKIVGRYDKSMLTGGDADFYSAGDHIEVIEVKGYKLGFLICYDSCYPEMYNIYRHKGVKLMFHSFYNAHHDGETILDEIIPAEIRVRASDNMMWVIANNSTGNYSSWPACIARPDGSLESLERGVPGILYREFPDEKESDQFRSWLHNFKMMKLPEDEIYQVFGKPSKHPRALDTKSLP